MNYNPAIHHRRSIRLKGYDYSQEGMYYITICCHNRNCLLGDVVNGEIILNEYGTIAFNEWLNTPNIRRNVELDVFVIMPNHIHGIIILNGRGELHSPCMGGLNPPQNPPDITPHDHPIDNKWGELHSPLIGPSNNIGAIVRGYKSSVTKQINLLNIGCTVWQRNYWEHIIRNEQSHNRISAYIANNPAKWNDDKFYIK
jgi:putative transposase